MMIRKLILLAAIVSGVGVAASLGARPSKTAPTETSARLDALLAEHRASSPNIPGEVLTVVTPQWHWSGATGYANGKSTPMTVNQTFRIASVTKPYTAAAVLRLMEMGKLDITKPIAALISDASAAALRKGGYDPSTITVQQLLSHTSGIYDYAQDENFTARVMADPAHHWTRIEQINHAMTYGKPIDLPGKSYAYSDTGYVLLGEIIERQTGQNLGRAVRTLLRFDRLKLQRTYWEQLEPKPANASIAAHFIGKVDMTGANPSLDLFGGGGIVSTVGDTAIFYRALVRGDVFDDRRTLAVMMTSVGAKRPVGDPGMHNNGLYLVRMGRWQCWGHAGFWGQLVAYCPESDVTFAWTFNQAEVSNDNMHKFANDVAAVIAP
jgi:D-alanyl-D-alanine carboxypeptidase